MDMITGSDYGIEIDTSIDLFKSGKQGYNVWFNSNEWVEIEMPVNKESAKVLKHLILQINSKVIIRETHDESYDVDYAEPLKGEG